MRLVDEQSAPIGGLTMCVCRIVHGPDGSGPTARPIETDEKGRLALTRPSKHGCIVWAKIDGRFVRVCDVLGGDTALDLGDVSTTAHELRGTILDVDGVPAAHLPVFVGPVETAFGSRWPIEQTPVAFTNHAGRFVIPGLPRREHNVASRSRRSLVTFAEVVTPGSKPIRFRLQRAPRIEGRVIDEAGQPVSGVRLSTSVAPGTADPRIKQYGLWTTHGQADGQGRFAIPAVAPNLLHTVTAFVRGSELTGRADNVEPPAKDLEIALQVRK